MKRLAGLLSGALLATTLAPAAALAHPLGNFSISHYARLVVRPDAVDLAYVVDLAEIPTFQEVQEGGIVTEVGHPSVAPYLSRMAERLGEGLRLEVNGRRLPLTVASTEVLFPAGAGGLPTMKVGVRFRSDLGDAVLRPANELWYRDDNFADRAGWKEIVAIAEAGMVIVGRSVPERDRSGGLSDYPTDLLSSPPQDLEARVTFSAQVTVVEAPAAPPPRPASSRSSPSPVVAATAPPEALADRAVPGSVALALVPNRQETPRSAFTALVATPRLGLSVVLLALVTALGVGALHALEPGHGKTVVAAYLVGSRGTAWHAVFLGLVVTASHTAGVFLLGVVTLYASRLIVPERVYPWLGTASGLTIAGLGVWLFLRRYAGGAAHGHGGGAHDHHRVDEHGHAHGECAGDGVGGHHHHHHHHHHPAERPVSLRELFALGLTGGIVPCPAALVVLLSALALRRIGFGLVLIVAFSVGLAAVLIAIGLVMVYARRLMSGVHGDGPLLTRWLPLTSAVVVTLLGAVIAVQALVAGGIVQIRL